MASSKEIRPTSQHRSSASSTPSSSLPVRQPTSRHHSHSVSLGSFNPTHRVTRRKSMSSTAASNVAAMAAAVKEAGDGSFAMPLPSNRRSMTSRSSFGAKSLDPASSGSVPGFGNYPSPPNSLAINNSENDRSRSSTSFRDSSAIAEGTPMPSVSEENPNNIKARNRRASEGAHIVKGDGKRNSGSELKCEKCGKGYKHSSCLTKHLWEHTPEWSYTSKLLISKHQQVQLLEAASVLVSMTQDAPTPPDSAKISDSDHSSASPAASGSSEFHDGMSSTDTTPPPQVEEPALTSFSSRNAQNGRSKRYSNTSSAYSRSYQSAPSHSLYPGSAPDGSPGFHQYHPSNISGDEDEAGLAAAVELLSCSFGTPRSGPVTLPPDVPPVPPLPARFLGQVPGRMATPVAHRGKSTTSRYAYQNPDDSDVKMESEESVADEEEFGHHSSSRALSIEDDDGVFGRMEE